MQIIYVIVRIVTAFWPGERLKISTVVSMAGIKHVCIQTRDERKTICAQFIGGQPLMFEVNGTWSSFRASQHIHTYAGCVCVCVCLILRAQIKHQMADLFLNALRKIRQLDKKQMKYKRTHLKCCCFSFMCVNVKH